MTDSSPLDHDDLGRTLARLKAGLGASEVHGSLVGFLSGGGRADPRRWPEALAIDLDDDSDARMAVLYPACLAQLEDPELGFEPLLPRDDAPLSDRADALVAWCRGFLGGIGLAGAGHPGTCSADATEILRDVATIAGSSFDLDDEDEDEAALTEVLEFVRVGVLLLYGEFNGVTRPGATAPPSRRLH